ncbi:transcription factor Adf-1-like [Drosophila suzukii]|uniref:Transcription factor Adf-1-like n=1 Tax=Drosophila suzukii TaxID=28584 RepID=A0AB40AFC6_DROSZ|nr:transcription factor Adf-1-like [Drosophila suzukii]XP_036677967.1 transcription factor Adf-1-like [Drosophila suzukii]
MESYFEKGLITLIQQEDMIYNYGNVNYRNAKLKMEVWEEIARKLKKSVKQCRLKWKALRDQYAREHKRLRTLMHIEATSRWKHYDSLSFLQKYMKQKTLETLENYINGDAHHDDEEEDDEDEEMETTTAAEQTPQQQEQHVMTYDHDDGEDDEIGAFFKTVAMKIRNAQLEPVAFTELQIEILRVINEALRNH